MPTFTAIAFDRLLEPGSRIQSSKPPPPPVKLVRLTSNKKRFPLPQVSPALYATPATTLLPDSPSSFPLTPYIVNHKRRGPRLLNTLSQPPCLDAAKLEPEAAAGEGVLDGVHDEKFGVGVDDMGDEVVRAEELAELIGAANGEYLFDLQEEELSTVSNAHERLLNPTTQMGEFFDALEETLAAHGIPLAALSLPAGVTPAIQLLRVRVSLPTFHLHPSNSFRPPPLQPHLPPPDYALTVLLTPHPNPRLCNRALLALSRATSASPRRVLLAYARLRRASVWPDRFTLPLLLQTAARDSEGKAVVREAHSLAAKTGLDDDPFVQTAMVGVYGAHHRAGDAGRVFDRMSHQDLVPWSVVINRGYLNMISNVGIENHSFSSYPDSGDSSPRSGEIVDSDNPSLSWDEPAASKVKLMCSCGGRIQPRHRDNQLSFVGGETKILAVERSIRFPAFAAILPAAAVAADVCFKYQLFGEDLDALISITIDEDLDPMKLEYERLLRPATRPTPRLFLFPLALSPWAPEQKSGGQWLVSALDSAPAQPEPTPVVAAAGPDFLFGLDIGFVPLSAIKVNDPSPPPPVIAPSAPLAPTPEPVAVEPIPSEAPVKDETGAEAVADIQRQIKDLQKLQIAAENQQATLTTAVDFYMPRASEKVAPAQMSPAYWPDQRFAPTGSRYASIIGDGDQLLYMFPGPYPDGAVYAALPRMVPAELYAMGPPTTVAKGMYVDGVVRSGALPVTAPEAQGFGMTCVSAGWMVCYTGSVVLTYQTMAWDL